MKKLCKERICNKCKVNKPLTEFYKDRTATLGHSRVCIICTKASRNKKPLERKCLACKDIFIAHLKAGGQKFCGSRCQKLYRAYGIDEYKYEDFLISQDYKCAICKEELKGGINQALDHDHSNGKVRGILCTKCNQGLGFFKDKISSLENAIKYLKENE